MSAKGVFISVIVPMHNAKETILELIHALENQTFKDFEVIIVDDASNDSSADLVKNYKTSLDIKLLSQPNSGPAAARNKAIKEARGSIICFTDSDCVPKPDWQENILREFSSNPGVQIISGALENKTNGYFTAALHVCWAHSLTPESKKGLRLFATTANMAIKKTVLESIGFFDEAFIMAEDTELSIRAAQKGYKILFCPNCIVEHAHRRNNLLSYLKHRFDHGAWEAIANLKCKPCSYSHFFSKNVFLQALFLPLLVPLSIGYVFFNAFSIKNLVYFPAIAVGRIAWGLGVLNGSMVYNKTMVG